jgi:hypothetical protein
MPKAPGPAPVKPKKGDFPGNEQGFQGAQREWARANGAHGREKRPFERFTDYQSGQEQLDVPRRTSDLCTDFKSVQHELGGGAEQNVLLDSTYSSPEDRSGMDRLLDNDRRGQEKELLSDESEVNEEQRGRVHRVDVELDKEYVAEDMQVRQKLAQAYERLKKESGLENFDELLHDPEKGKELRKQLWEEAGK